MRIRSWGLTILMAAVLTALTSCNGGGNQTAAPAPVVDTRAADEAKIRATDADWVKAAATKDPPQMANYYADGAALMLPGEAVVNGKEAITKTFASLASNPGFSLTFADEGGSGEGRGSGVRDWAL
jgi:hypothetical protein